MNIVVDSDDIDFFQDTCRNILNEIFNLNLSDVLVTDITSILDFSYTQDELDNHILLINRKYNIDLNITKDYRLVSLCRQIDLNKSTLIRH
jgi:hypothetical protein